MEPACQDYGTVTGGGLAIIKNLSEVKAMQIVPDKLAPVRYRLEVFKNVKYISVS